MEDDRQPRSAVSWVLEHSQHKRNTGYVLIKLAQCIDAGDNCPSHNELAEMTGLTKPTIQHALGELEKDGTIAITRRGGNVKRGGKKNCYQITGYAKSGKEVLPGEDDPVKKPGKNILPGKDDPVKNDDITHSQTTGAASTTEYARARLEDININTKKTTTTTVVVAEKPIPPDSDDDKPLSEQAGDLGDVARAYDKYIRGTMNSQSADLFEVLIEDYGAAKVVEAFKAAFAKNDPWDYAMWWLKHPEIVDKPKTPAPAPKQMDMISQAEKDAARRAFNHDVPEFSKLGTPT